MCLTHFQRDGADLELDRHPTAGAQYHWSYFLAPRGRRFISFFQGELLAALFFAFFGSIADESRLGHRLLVVCSRLHRPVLYRNPNPGPGCAGAS